MSWMRLGAGLALVGAMLLSCATELGRGSPVVGSSCDRRCLLEYGDDYVNALTFKDKAQILPRLAENVRITKNGTSMGVGEGILWSTVAGVPVRQSFADPVTGNYVMFAVSRNAAGQRGQLVIRVRV